MTLVHLWAVALGAAALGLPVAIHLLTRPRPRKLPLSTLRFVRDAVQQRRARRRLRDILVLLLRTAAVALLALAFARPLLGHPPLIEPHHAGKAVRIVIVDQSLGMGAASEGATAFDRARAVAGRYLAYDGQTSCDLILAAARPQPVVDRLTTNFAALRDELEAAKVRSERFNAQAALNAAGEMLASAPVDASVRRELVIVSDFQRSNWASADFSPIPKQAAIEFESVAPKSPPANFAVLRVQCQGRVEQGRPLRMEVDVGNYSPAPRNVKVHLALGAASYELSGLCAPGGMTTLSTDVVPRDSGWIAGQAAIDTQSIGRDALAADDSRAFVLDVRPAPTFALITREPDRIEPTSSYFLDRALAPEARTDATGDRVVRLDPARLDRQALGSADLIVLDHPGKLPQASAALLAELMRRGRPVLYVAAEPVDAGNLKLIADAAGSDLKMPVEFVPPSAGLARRGLFLADIHHDQMPFAAFGENLSAAVGPLRFAGGLDSREIAGGLSDDVVARYGDRSAAMVVTACGAGALAVWNTDLATSNVHASQPFVPLVAELVGRLLGGRHAAEALACGEPTAQYLPPGAGGIAGLTISPPADSPQADVGTLAAEGDFVAWRWPVAGPPGVWNVRRGDKTVFVLATAAPGDQSDLQTIDPAVLKDRLASGRNVDFHAAGAQGESKDTAWAWLAVACGLCLFAEVATLKVFGT